eukprot:3398962-Pleurochrysis_carterae.AAC.1
MSREAGSRNAETERRAREFACSDVAAIAEEHGEVDASVAVACLKFEALALVVLIRDEDARAVATVGHARRLPVREQRAPQRFLCGLGVELVVDGTRWLLERRHVVVDHQPAAADPVLVGGEPHVEVDGGGVGVEADALRPRRAVLEQPPQPERVRPEDRRRSRVQLAQELRRSRAASPRRTAPRRPASRAYAAPGCRAAIAIRWAWRQAEAAAAGRSRYPEARAALR